MMLRECTFRDEMSSTLGVFSGIPELVFVNGGWYGASDLILLTKFSSN